MRPQMAIRLSISRHVTSDEFIDLLIRSTFSPYTSGRNFDLIKYSDGTLNSGQTSLKKFAQAWC